MGKKNRRNRAKKNKIAATTAEDSLAAVLDGVFSESEAAALSATAVGNSGDDTRACYHGSNKEAFRNDHYRKAGREYVESLMALQNMEERLHYDNALKRKHARLMIEEEFGKYLFAVCARNYILHRFSKHCRAMRCLLCLAIDVRYVYVPQEKGKVVHRAIDRNEKFNKYTRDILTVRGIVNVLARETRGCGCFKDAKKAARTMEKVGCCFGCSKVFPKERLLKCGCGGPQYCTRECQLKDWHRHKDQCIAQRKLKSKINTANGGDGDGDGDGGGGAGTAAKEEGTS